MFLALFISVILIIGLSAGLANKGKRGEESLSAAPATGSAGDDAAVDAAAGNASTVTDSNLVNDGSTTAPVTTAPPTDTVAIVSTVAPTPSPTACNFISVDASCYQILRDDVMVSFNICQASSMDWAAIYPEGLDINNMNYPELTWTNLCGDQSCTNIVSGGTLNMGSGTPEGRYQVYLFSNAAGDQGEPYSAIAVSEVFEVGGCP